jgi:hypothetical protein
MPAPWWDLLLDGVVRRVELDRTPWHNTAAFRALVYREADTRRCLARTHQAKMGTVLVQAWGGQGLEAFTPNLKGPATLASAPVMPSTKEMLAELSRQVRSQPQAPVARPPTTYSAQVPAPVVDDLRHDPGADLGDDNIEDLLPPCSCGLGLHSAEVHPPSCRVWG